MRKSAPRTPRRGKPPATASRTTLNAKNFEALGAGRLAGLLIELSTGNAAAKRRLRLELAGSESPRAVANEVRKRLMAIARSHSFVNWQNRKSLTDDLETQRRAIVDQVARVDPTEGLELIWRFLALANPVFARCDDSSGTVIGIFHAGCRDLGETAARAKIDAEALADRVFGALNENDYGQYDALIEVLTPVLGAKGLNHLKARFLELSRTPVERPPDKERKVVGWATSGPIYADQLAASGRETAVRSALQDIADAQGDVDAYIAQQTDKARAVPRVAAEIASRLLKAGRAEEAWAAINAIDEDRPGWIPMEWEMTRVDVLDALGRRDEAQKFRWACFERSLSAEHLRAYLKRLPEFDDIEAEERALALAQSYPSVHQALVFLVTWPALEKAADLVTRRAAELNGDHYEIHTPAADALAGKQPLAATILLRAMIEFSLKKNKATRYRHAARHLAECASLAGGISDFGDRESHEAFVTRLKAEHGRKSSFWNLVS